MVYTDCDKASQFKFKINENFVWSFLNQKNILDYQNLDVRRISEIVEDRINLIDLSKYSIIPIHKIILKVLEENKDEKRCE